MRKIIAFFWGVLAIHFAALANDYGAPEAHLGGVYTRDWIQVGQSIHGIVYYIDSKHEKTGRFRRTLEVESYSKPMSKNIMSTLMEKEYDCIEDRERTIWIRYFSGKKVDGEMLGFLDKATPWKKVPLSPSLRNGFMYVCGR